MRMASHLLSLSLVIAASAAAQTTAGVVAHGSVTLAGPNGAESGTITVAAWGEDRCKITIELGPAILHREYTAVVNGKRASITAPAGMLASAPLPIGPGIGCALLPEGLAYDRIAGRGASLALDPSSRMPSSLQWTEDDGRPAGLAYSGYQPGAAPLAASVTETVGGSVCLRIQFRSIADHSFTDADFALPPPPQLAKPARPAGGAQ